MSQITLVEESRAGGVHLLENRLHHNLAHTFGSVADSESFGVEVKHLLLLIVEEDAETVLTLKRLPNGWLFLAFLLCFHRCEGVESEVLSYGYAGTNWFGWGDEHQLAIGIHSRENHALTLHTFQLAWREVGDEEHLHAHQLFRVWITLGDA